MIDDLNRLCEYIKGCRSDMISLQSLLTSIKALAPENGGVGEFKKASALVQWLAQNGFSNIEHFDAPDSRAVGGRRPNIVVTIPGKNDDYSVWIMAHMDVVPEGELLLWKTDPWKVTEKDGRLYGRGVEDNQQGLVSGVFAALSFIKLGIVPAHTVKLLFIADEEVGSKYGIRYLLEQHNLFKKNDVILIPDSGDAKGETIEIAEKSILWLKIHTVGKQAHGSRPDLARNACLASCNLALRLHGLEIMFNKKDLLFEPPYSTFTPTMYKANVESINIIPGDNILCLDCRILPCYTLKEVIEAVRQKCCEVEKEYGVKIDFETPQAEESPATPSDAMAVTMLKRAIKQTKNLEARCVGIGGGTVGAYLRRAGYETAVWSTMDDMCHQPNEYCVIDNMVSDAQTFASLMLE